MNPDKLTAGLAVAHLYRRYPAPEFFCVHEPNLGGSGEGNYCRRADFMALRLWGGVSQAPLGFEVKVSRSDFLKEVNSPDKRAPMEEFCSGCYFVAPAGIFREDEIPTGWGWLQLGPAGLRMKKAARISRKPPEAGLLGTLMKRLIDDRWHDRARRPVVVDVTPELFKFAGLEMTPNQLMGEARKMFKLELDHATAEGKRLGREEERKYGSRSTEDHEALLSAICKATGLSRWDVESAERLSTALKAGFNKDHGRIEAVLAKAVYSAEMAHADVTKLLESLKRAQTGLGGAS